MTVPIRWKSQSQVNTTDAAAVGGFPTQWDGQVVALLDGGYFVVWTDDSHVLDATGSTIVGQRYNALGNKVGGEQVFNRLNRSGDKEAPAIAVHGDGGIAVAYEDTANGRLVFESTSGVTFAFDILPQSTDPAVAVLSNGHLLLAFTRGTGDDTDIFGDIREPEFGEHTRFIIHDEADNSGNVELAVLSDGNFVAVFQDEFNGSATDIDIRYRIFTPDGVPLDVPLFASSSFSTEVDPDVAALKGGGFVLVWTDFDGDGEGNQGLRAAIFNNAGGFVKGFAVNATTAGLQNEASVTALYDGGFLVAWEDDAANLVRAQRFNAAGSKVGPEFTMKNGVSDASPVTNDSPDLAALADGRVALVAGDLSTGDHDVVTSIWDVRDRPFDFNADGFGDILWRNVNSGQVTTWELNGAGAIDADGYGAAGLVWQQVAAGDTNGDGRSDILWRNTSTGQLVAWELNGAGGFAFRSYGSASTVWQAVGSGDFNADGKDDVLYRNTSTGQVATWELNGAGGFAFDSYGAAGLAWKVAGIGDFNADGQDDILWRNSSTGQVATWELNGAGGFAFDIYGAAGLAWHIFGVGDFNTDGKDDILWRNSSTGQVATWELNGAGAFAFEGYGSANSQWEIESVLDTNSDGIGDVLFRNTSTGAVAAWELNGAGGFSFQGYGATSLSWQIFDGNFQFV